MKKRICVFLLLFLLMFMFACNNSNETEKTENNDYKFSIDLNDVNINVGEKYTIDVANESADLYFESSDSNVAMVNASGVITGKSEGSATITISLLDNEKVFVTLKVNVSKVKDVTEPTQKTETKNTIKSLSITGANSVDVGKVITIVATYTDGFDVDLEWSLSDNELASFDGINFTALQPGNVTITVKDKISGLESSKTITINTIKTSEETANEILEWAINEVGTEGANEVKLVFTHPSYPTSSITWESSDSVLFDPEEGLLDIADYDQVVNVTCNVSYEGVNVSRTYEYTIISYPLYQMAEKFIGQFKTGAIFNSVNLTTSYTNYGGTTVVWRSGNPSILANDGTFTRPYNSTYFEVYYTVTLTEHSVSRSFTKLIRAEGMNINQKAELVVDYLTNNVGYDGCISSDTEMPTYISEYEATIEWFTTTGDELDLSVVAGNPILSETAITVVAKITIDGEHTSVPIQFIALSKDLSTKWDLIDLFVQTMASQGVNQFKYTLITWVGPSYGYVPFTTNLKPIIEDAVLPYTYGNQRTGIVRSSTEYITVHDTGNTNSGATAEMHKRYITNLNNNPDSTSISWHFTVDEEGIIQHLPTNEVAWHAGDGGSVQLAFYDTGVKYTGIVNWSITDDGYYAVNGTKTSIAIPRSADGTPYLTAKVPALGFNYKVGSNGNIWMGSTYYNASYNTIANRGGNLNSISIESCVNEGSDYTQTMRYLAKLVANLCIEYNLTPDRVKQHNTFSGKNCPQVLRESNRWDEFMVLVKLNYFAMTQLTDCQIEYKSLSPDIMDDTGKILKKVDNNTVINYEIKITYGGETKTYTKQAVVNSKLG